MIEASAGSYNARWGGEGGLLRRGSEDGEAERAQSVLHRCLRILFAVGA